MKTSGLSLRVKLARLTLLAAASLWLASCGDGSVNCEIDPVFTDNQQSEIRRAADVWNSLTVRPVTFAPQGEGDWLILPASVTLNRLGYAERKRRLIRINPVTPDNQIYAVALHEFGAAYDRRIRLRDLLFLFFGTAMATLLAQFLRIIRSRIARSSDQRGSMFVEGQPHGPSLRSTPHVAQSP